MLRKLLKLTKGAATEVLPANLTIRLSAIWVDASPPSRLGLPTSTVHRDGESRRIATRESQKIWSFGGNELEQREGGAWLDAGAAPVLSWSHV